MPGAALHFGEWDGRSAQTNRAVQRFEAKGLDLNENWALSEQFWSCPSCKRSKDEIFRLSRRGILLAKLEWHHDHAQDGIWHRARDLFGEGWIERIPKSSLRIMDQIRDLTSRFDACLVCSECNAADGKVKSRFRSEIDSRFSFTALEIGSFVQPQPRLDHEINYVKALDLWQREKDKFLTRMELIDELLTHLVNGRLTYNIQGSARGVSAFDPNSILAQSFYRATKHTERAGLLWDLRGEFLARSTQRDSAKLAPAGGQSKSVIMLTDEEYAAYVDPVSGKRWQATTEDWACSVCERSKRQILRKSKSGKWTGGIRSHLECTLETDTNRRRLFPDFRNDIFLRDIVAIGLCSDCAGIGTALGQRDQSIRDPYLGIKDRRACISVSKPNDAHEIDFEDARRRAIANDSYGPASAAFYAFREKVNDFQGRFDRWRRRGGVDQTMIEELADDICVFHRIDNPSERLNLVKWILEQHLAPGK